MELDADFLGSLNCEEAHSLLAIVVDLGVRVVVTDDDVISFGEADHLGEEFLGGDRRGGIVGVADPQEGGPVGHGCGNRGEVGQKPVFLTQRHEVRITAAEEGADVVHRVAWVRDQHHVPRIHES